MFSKSLESTNLWLFCKNIFGVRSVHSSHFVRLFIFFFFVQQFFTISDCVPIYTFNLTKWSSCDLIERRTNNVPLKTRFVFNKE